MIRGQGERDGAAPVVARDRVPGEPQVLAQQLVDVGRDSPLVVAAGGPGRIAQTAQVRRETRPRAVGMLVQLRGSRLMDPAGLLPAIRALRLRRRGGLAGAMGVRTGPGRGLDASALQAQCGCWSSAARRGLDGASEFDVQGGESRIDRRQSTPPRN